MSAFPVPSSNSPKDRENQQHLMDILEALEKSLLEEISSIEHVKLLREKIRILSEKILDPKIVSLIQPLIEDMESCEKRFTVIDKQKMNDDLLKIQEYLRQRPAASE
jgi:hypothetical protein